MKEIPIRRHGCPITWLAPNDLALYRGATLGLLRRYFRLSLEVGRLPSLLGREFFRARLTSCREQSFEDAAIFVHDLERSLEVLDGFSRRLLARVVFQEYSREEAAALLGCARRTVFSSLARALDRLSAHLLERGLLTLLPLHDVYRRGPTKTCQEGKMVENLLTSCQHGK